MENSNNKMYSSFSAYTMNQAMSNQPATSTRDTSDNNVVITSEEIDAMVARIEDSAVEGPDPDSIEEDWPEVIRAFEANMQEREARRLQQQAEEEARQLQMEAAASHDDLNSASGADNDSPPGRHPDDAWPIPSTWQIEE